jgi:hypothetical protein
LARENRATLGRASLQLDSRLGYSASIVMSTTVGAQNNTKESDNGHH